MKLCRSILLSLVRDGRISVRFYGKPHGYGVGCRENILSRKKENEQTHFSNHGKRTPHGFTTNIYSTSEESNFSP